MPKTISKVALLVGLPVLLLAGGVGVWRLAGMGSSNQHAFTLHIIGDSTAFGEPYGPDLNVGSIVSYLFGGTIAEKPVIVLNRAMPGADSARVLDHVDDVPDDASLVFLYAGHNEFLKIEEPEDLSKIDRALIDRDPLSLAERRAILDSYEKNIAKIIEALKERGVPVIVSTLASNIADWEPNRTTLENPQNRPQIETLSSAAIQALRSSAPQIASGSLLEIIQIEPKFAWAHMELANLLRAERQFDEARHHYRLAAEYDALPYRALQSQNDSLRRLARRYGVPLVDSAAAVEEGSRDGLVGYDIMWDNCHPTLEGYLAIAKRVADEVTGMFGSKPSVTDDSVDALERYFGFDADDRLDVLHSRGRFLYSAATLLWNPEKRLARAKHYLDNAAAIKPDAGVLSSLAIVHALMDNPAESSAYWRQALALDPRITRDRWNNPRVQQIMQRSPALQQELATLRSEIGPRWWFSRFL
jgi:lysophospholipase L1-like esterase